MTHKTRKKLLTRLDVLKLGLSTAPEFFEDDDSETRGIFVVLLTLEGAIAEGDVEELAQQCVAFAKHKQREALGKDEDELGPPDPDEGLSLGR
jgi:hypothetical protein